MKICLISNQIAAWNKIGGFGTATRAIGAGLAKRGVEVTAVVPRRAKHGQPPIQRIDGITVYGTGAWSTSTSGRVFREIGADVYHSQEPTIASYLAQRAVPDAVHVVTCRDPRSMADHFTELRYTNHKRRALFPYTWYYEASPWVKRAVRRATAVFTPAPCLIPKVKQLYGASVNPIFVPSPIDVPAEPVAKAVQPLALFVGRWDRRKRIERFFELAQAFPQIRFVAVGQAHDAKYDRTLRQRYRHMPNVEMPGFLSRFADDGLDDLYRDAWILVNTSAREGLPYTFVEAASWGCAILSCMDPDQFATRFGYFVRHGDFEAGLRWLLECDRWHTLGQAGACVVRRVFGEANSLHTHLQHYRCLLKYGKPATSRSTLLVEESHAPRRHVA